MAFEWQYDELDDFDDLPELADPAVIADDRARLDTAVREEARRALCPNGTGRGRGAERPVHEESPAMTPTTPRGRELLRLLAERVGKTDVDLDDEHDRWAVYADAVPREDLRPLLKQAVVEGDEMARVVVVDVLQHVDIAEGRSWVDGLGTSSGRTFAERRLREWALIHDLVARPRSIVDDLPDLTLWCQRQLVDRVAADVVLDDLAEHGTSRKVRHAARARRAGRRRVEE
ncbi:hypothetical protein [Cellulosimicrobium sp. SH8]|uniref:hypothetical protein n=1 Tax=Cellulosimicrobium sp. SH8 TaxID=2952936 RepID=UPI0021F3AB2C|nr:hypothetical protein [Cellulosimicrobium sp. SH8]